ncbi:hypothetical protein SS50377_22365 [Spironucleus salmonicida]|uniref:Uncharacterized protein n=1 Tax=Spironucleus salmonicida TaxID=348837 RepID=V6LCB1_9EUKA|nr:hypothetical protein SS50377_22365 [Spironucleus salmonicida]|eukprot:EST42140.1 Hypothetical protein SS50377_18448 [Spironucleus salmonicida]
MNHENHTGFNNTEVICNCDGQKYSAPSNQFFKMTKSINNQKKEFIHGERPGPFKPQNSSSISFEGFGGSDTNTNEGRKTFSKPQSKVTEKKY